MRVDSKLTISNKTIATNSASSDEGDEKEKELGPNEYNNSVIEDEKSIKNLKKKIEELELEP